MEEKTKKKFSELTKIEKAWKIISTTFVAAFALLAATFLVSSIIIKASGGDAMSFGNTEVRLVLTDSMEWTKNTPDSKKGYDISYINTNDAVFVYKAPSSDDVEALKAFHDELQVGDVVSFTYRNSSGLINVTHRIVSKLPYGNGYEFTMQGDNYGNEEEPVTPGVQYIYTCTDLPDKYPLNSFVGKVTGVSSSMGGFLALSRSKLGIIFLILVPCAAIIIFEVIKIVNVVRLDKKEKLETIKQEQTEKAINDISSEDDIEKLKKLLAEKEAELKKKKENE